MKPYEYGLLELDLPSFNATLWMVGGAGVWVLVWCLVISIKRRKEGEG
jgi:hypothetical protein